MNGTNITLPTTNPGAPPVVYAVDPGVSYYALARFVSAELASVSIYPINGRISFGYPPNIEVLVIEVPQILERAAGTKQGRARKSDVADTLFAAGRIADRYERVIKVTPAQWKGQLPKKIDHERTYEALTEPERRIIDAVRTKEERGHIMDAVGIGLVYLWRR